MKTQIFTLLALASSAQVATATFQWLDAQKFSCPANTDNKCIEPQKNGFTWEGLNLGSFTKFGDFDFDGFTCADSFDGKIKRDEITGRTFQNKCIKSKVTKEKTPSFGCGSSKSVEKFSVKTFQVSVEFDVDLEFHYSMPDGSTCKQKQSCKKSGTTVKNTQCGGATKVKVTLPSGSDKGKGCDVGFHHIDFDCAPPQPSSSAPVTSSTAPATKPVTTPATTPASSTAAIPTPSPETSSTSSASPVESTSVASSTSSESTSAPASSTAAIPTPTPESSTSSASPIESTTALTPLFPLNTTSPPVLEIPSSTLPTVLEPTTVFSTSVFTETHVSTITSCGADVKDCPAGSSTVITQTSVTSTIVPITTAAPPAQQSTVVVVDHTTVIVEVSTTLCPVTLTHITAGSTTIETGISTSTIFLTSTSTICTKCTTVATTAAQSPVETSSVATSSPVEPTTVKTTPSAPSPTADCPAVLPQCLNTWLFSSGCKSNTDVDCFCSSNNFVDNVYKCLSAHGASDDEVDSAEKYFQGICAAHVPENPAIVTAVNTLTLTATATPSAHTAPVTTIILQTTIVVPCTQTAGPSEGSIIPGSSTTQIISTAITVPQVVFQTVTGTSTNVVSLVQGTPTSTTAAAGITNPAFTTPLVVVPITTLAPTTFASVSFTPSNTLTSAFPAFTGAASRAGMKAGSFLAAGFVAMLAL